MNILVSNDDGIKEQGLRALVEALSDVGKVYVCAPDGQRSATSHSITMKESIRIKSVNYENAELAMTTTGTPADCVRLGIKVLKDIGIEIDMVFSGINMGGNLGSDILYSGTVAAAIEGSILGKPAVAVSVNSHQAKNFDYAGMLAVNCAKYAYDKIPEGHILNINVPDLPSYNIKGVKFAKLGPRDYRPWFNLENGIEGTPDLIDLEYRYGSELVEYDELTNEYDVKAMENRYATITPLKYDMTDFELLKEIPCWGLEKKHCE